jgi:AcrR family transcriptional regulator
MIRMATVRRSKPAKKRSGRYHHGDLQPALLQAALCTIQKQGVEAVTLRGVGKDVGVSRTALYRHFADKSALLRAVAREGFRMLRLALVERWEREGKGTAGFESMGMAYVQFAVNNPSHYRVMFGASILGDAADPELTEEGAAAFKVLVDALVEQQAQNLVRRDEPLQLALFIWSMVHGIAMLAIDGRLQHQHGSVEELARFAMARTRTGIATNR